MTCPKCGSQMTGGAPHGPEPVQWECRRCNVFVGVDPVSGPDRQVSLAVTKTFECDDCHQRKPAIEETYEGSNYCRTCDARPSPLAAQVT